jgi:hypothetical protein
MDKSFIDTFPTRISKLKEVLKPYLKNNKYQQEAIISKFYKKLISDLL